MNYQEAEHEDVFEVFGDVASTEIDLVANENTIEPVKPREIKTGFSWAAFSGGLAALVWVAGAIGGPLSYFGIDAVMQMNPLMQAGLAALAFGPAILFWLGAAAAGEAVKARRLATEIARLTQLAQMPVEVGENHAKRLTLTVKNEIEQLNDAVASALNRLAELETVAKRNAHLFDSAVAATRENIDVMGGHLVREREALVALNGDLVGQTETMANSIGRQVRLMREASKLVKTEITAAEDALETHLASFSASATVMAERTSEFHQAADSAAHATTSLNHTMSTMLDGLSEATQMTDAARKSTENAVLAANETAAAVRETTQRAVVEAKRAAQFIRSETVAMQEAANDTMARLQEAANAARAASEESQAAADRHAASIEKRLAALASTASTKKAAPAPQPAPRVEEPVDVYAAATAARTAQRPQVRIESPKPKAQSQQERGFKGFGGWGNFLPNSRDEDHRVKATPLAEEVDAFDLVDFKPSRKDPEQVLKSDAIEMVVAAGVDLDDTLQASDLETIAQRSRHGAAARRQAVVDAAPGAVNRIARHVKRNSDAKLVATEFRSRPDLAKSEIKSEAQDLVRTYLLIDAALD